MSLAAKGLLHHIRLECWENGDVPADHKALSKVIGCDQSEVSALLHECMPFLSERGGALISPELESYREKLSKIRSVRSEAGKVGGKNKANARNLSQQKAGSVNQTKPNQTHAVNGEPITTLPSHSDWLKEYGDV